MVLRLFLLLFFHSTSLCFWADVLSHDGPKGNFCKEGLTLISLIPVHILCIPDIPINHHIYFTWLHGVTII